MKKRINVNYSQIIAFAIVTLVLFLSIGWAALNSSFSVDSMAMVRIKSDIRVTGFSYVSGTSGVMSSSEEYNVSYVTASVTLPEANSTATYNVEISNMELASNVNMGIYGLFNLPSNLKIISINGYTLKDKICDDNNATFCGSGSQKTFSITIGYADNAYDVNNTIQTFGIDFEFRKVHNIIYNGFINEPITPKTIMDNDTVTIDLSGDSPSTINVLSGGATLVEGTNYTYNNHILTFITPIRDDVYVNVPSIYTITYELDGGVQAPGQISSYSTLNNEPILPPSKEGYVFGGWYTNSDFSTDVITHTNQLSGNVTLYASWGNGIAKIGNTYYNTLQAAIDAVPTNNTETTVILLADTAEYVTVLAGKNVILNLQHYILSNIEAKAIFENYGTLSMSAGSITSNTTQGAVNVYPTGVFNMSGGSISTTGTKQGIWNSGGTVNISGTAEISSTSNNRPAVHNLAGGTMTITGGTITSTRYCGVENLGTLTIGTKDGTVDSTPYIRGNTNGIKATANYNYYDGVIYGKNAAVNDSSFIADIETGYEIINSTETISSVSYYKMHLGIKYTVTFNANGGTVDENERSVEQGTMIGVLPTPTYTGFIFDGWYTEATGGREILQNEIINADIEIFAHWLDSSQYFVALIGSTRYSTLQAAIDAVPKNNSETTIQLVRNVTENVNVTSGQNIVFDFQNYTISNSTAYSVITNTGTIRISNGTILTNSATASAINNNSGGRLFISGGTVIATGARQAVYNDGGTTTISGTVMLKASSSERATVHNLNNGTINILGGTIISTNQQAVNNASGTINIGTKDGSINATSPVLQGATYGITNAGTFNFYDGVIRGETGSVDGTISDIPDNATEVDTEEIINGITYQKKYLQGN